MLLHLVLCSVCVCFTLLNSSTGWLYRRVLMTSNGVMVIVTATPLIMAAVSAVSQLLGPNHCEHNRKLHKPVSLVLDSILTHVTVLVYICRCARVLTCARVTQSLAELNVAS